jgi:hypothetical protein
MPSHNDVNQGLRIKGYDTMTIEAPLSRYTKQNLLIAVAALIGLGIWFYYDGYHNETFIKKNTTVDEQGNERPNSTLAFNQKAPPFMIAAGIGIAVYFFVVRGKKVAADEAGLKACGKTIAYDAIESINKTHFDSKGFFIVTYKDPQGQSRELKLSKYTYDDMPAVLDHLIAKIS